MTGLSSKVEMGVEQAASLIMRPTIEEFLVVPRFHAVVECLDADGNLRWRDEIYNLVTTAGKNHALNVLFRATSPGTWYVGLKGAGSAAAGDTAASHAGWSEVTAYAEATRVALTLAAPSGGSANNSASKAVFTMNAGATVAGAFLINNNTKGGATGELYSGGDFTGGSRTVQSGDTLSVTMTLTAA